MRRLRGEVGGNIFAVEAVEVAAVEAMWDLAGYCCYWRDVEGEVGFGDERWSWGRDLGGWCGECGCVLGLRE